MACHQALPPGPPKDFLVGRLLLVAILLVVLPSVLRAPLVPLALWVPLAPLVPWVPLAPLVPLVPLAPLVGPP